VIVSVYEEAFIAARSEKPGEAPMASIRSLRKDLLQNQPQPFVRGEEQTGKASRFE
jgi:hypothetical protein